MFDFTATHRLADGGVSPFYSATISYSCRFNDDDSAYTAWAGIGTPTDVRKFTFNTWVKRCNLSSRMSMISQYVDATNFSLLEFQATDKIRFYAVESATDYSREWTPLFRDVASWYNIHLIVDFAQADADDRVQLWVNGVRIADYASASGIFPQNYDQIMNSTSGTMYVGFEDDANDFLDGYLSKTHFIDGQALTPSSFGKFKSNIWIPNSYSGTYGDNGFYLDYSDSSDFGSDQSGNGNDFTDGGLAANDQVLDSPTNNYPTLNLLDTDTTGLTANFFNGNLVISTRGTGEQLTRATMAFPSSGKWYYEVLVPSDEDNWFAGVLAAGDKIKTGTHLGFEPNSCSYLSTGNIYINNAIVQGGLGAIDAGDVLGVAVNTDAGEISFYKNNSLQGTAETLPILASDDYWVMAISSQTNDAVNDIGVNFGQLGFTHTPPTGFKALCSANLPEPTVLDSDKGFDVVLYEGTGAEKVITDLEFQPNLVWIKNRDAADQHVLTDSVRGVTKELNSDSTAIETTVVQGLKSFGSSGFTLGTDDRYNTNAESYVAWCFRTGAKYGFDIQTYEGTGAAKAENHDLGGVPELIITKSLGSVRSWAVYHHHALNKTDPETDRGLLDVNNAFVDEATYWNDTPPTNTQFTVGTDNQVNENTFDFVAYLWRSIPQFSKVFSYTGNGSADGPFVYCGFKPKYILIKDADAAQSWIILDTKRNTYNIVDNYLRADTAGVEDAVGENETDILSNGFKLRAIDAPVNTNAHTYVGIAYAEQPGKYSNAR